MTPPEAAQSSTAPGVWQVAARDPGRTALIVPGSDPVTFGALAAAANRLSNALRGLGVDAGDAVGRPEAVQILAEDGAAVPTGAAGIIWFPSGKVLRRVLREELAGG